MPTDLMRLKILLPFKIFSDTKKVSHIIAETHDGSFGILPHRLDCVAALSPGILSFRIDSQEDNFVALDQGILLKTGSEVLVSVRRALRGSDLKKLRKTVEDEFGHLEEREEKVRSVLKKMESGFIRRFVEFQHD